MIDLVSIVIPVYNVENYLSRCLNSVISQTYHNIEIVLINDGSTDLSLDICKDYKKNDYRIKIINQKNKGLSAARNVGIENSTGGWITFLDSDDFVREDYIETMINLAKKHNVKIVQCSSMRGSEDKFPKDVNNFNYFEKKWDFHSLYKSHNRDFKVTAWGKLYDIRLFDEYKYPIGKINEDEDTTFKVMYNAKKCVLTNKVLYYYYINSSGITMNKKYVISFDFEELILDRIDWLMKKNEMELIDITKKELCIRLLLRYINGYCLEIEKNHLNKLYDRFKKYYKSIDKIKIISFKERVIMNVFYRFPNISSFFVKIKNIVFVKLGTY